MCIVFHNMNCCHFTPFALAFNLSISLSVYLPSISCLSQHGPVSQTVLFKGQWFSNLSWTHSLSQNNPLEWLISLRGGMKTKLKHEFRNPLVQYIKHSTVWQLAWKTTETASLLCDVKSFSACVQVLSHFLDEHLQSFSFGSIAFTVIHTGLKLSDLFRPYRRKLLQLETWHSHMHWTSLRIWRLSCFISKPHRQVLTFFPLFGVLWHHSWH